MKNEEHLKPNEILGNKEEERTDELRIEVTELKTSVGRKQKCKRGPHVNEKRENTISQFVYINQEEAAPSEQPSTQIDHMWTMQESNGLLFQDPILFLHVITCP